MRSKSEVFARISKSNMMSSALLTSFSSTQYSCMSIDGEKRKREGCLQSQLPIPHFYEDRIIYLNTVDWLQTHDFPKNETQSMLEQGNSIRHTLGMKGY